MDMKKIIILMTFLATMFSLNAEKMNVLFIMPDDMGKGDLSFYGNPHLKTPSIDKLASESYRFENYHTGTTCAPTRSGLMTGMYSNKVGVWHTVMGRYILDKDYEILPQVFAKNGYATGLFGKWHLGDNYPYRPFDRGFETAFWFKGGGMTQTPDFWLNSYFDNTYFLNNTPVKVEGYCTDVLFDKAIEFMAKQKSENKAFLCYLTPNAAHFPFHVADKYSDKFKDNKNVPDACFYAMIENIDENMAKLNAFMKSSGLDKNTIIIFTTDNGSHFTETVDPKTNEVVGFAAGLRGKKAMVYEGGHNVPFFMKLPNGKSTNVDQLTGYIDIAPTLYELCEIAIPKNLDGISVKSVIDDPQKSIDRYMVVDTQRKELMDKNAPSVVMKGSMRLVDQKELYDLSKDPSQAKDIANDYPEVVAEFTKVYDKYWDYIADQNDTTKPIFLKAPNEDCVLLNTHDRHISCFWDQDLQIRGGRLTFPTGYWSVYVPEDGEYSFELFRWPTDLDVNIKDNAPAIPAIEGTSVVARPEKGAFPYITDVELIIGDITKTQSIAANENPRSISFNKIKLKKGIYQLFANFTISKKKQMGVHYIRVTTK